jgi:hypothetical protein
MVRTTIQFMPTLNRPLAFADTMTRISFLPSGERVDALLHYFVDVLSGMDTHTIRKQRDQIMERFSTCGCSFDTCVLMVEFIDGYLASRDTGPTHRFARLR